MRITGFRAYAVYLYVKNIHFADNNHNIMNKTKIPLRDKLLNSWNKKRSKKDGFKFLEIENEFTNNADLSLLYSSYYINNSNFYIQDMFEDDFEIFKKNIAELKLIKEVFTNDLNEFISYCKEEQIKPIGVFTSKNSIPKIFKMGLSFNSLVIINDLFNVIELNKDINVNSLEVELWEQIKLNITWYKKIINTYLEKYEWKKIAKEILPK